MQLGNLSVELCHNSQELILPTMYVTLAYCIDVVHGAKSVSDSIFDTTSSYAGSYREFLIRSIEILIRVVRLPWLFFLPIARGI